MTEEATQLLDEALRLPVQDRAKLASALIHSLDETVDPGAEEAWTAEINRRIEEVRAGTAELLNWDELRSRVWSKLGQR